MLNSKLRIGDRVSIKRAFSEDDVLMFSSLALDKNPIHIDPIYASQTNFGRQIVHGMLVSSLFSGLIGEQLPGKGTIYLGQTIKFVKPVFLDEEVEASVEVISIRSDKPIVTLKTICKTNRNGIVVEGEAVVKISKRSEKNG